MSSDNNINNKKEVDLFRDTPLRYLGYSNEVGEAFRTLVSRTVVRASYGAAFGYVFLDVIDKAKKTYTRETISPSSKDSPHLKTFKVASDCLLWQTFASVLLPGLTINRICAFSYYLLNKSNVKPLIQSSKVLTTGIGLLSIPLIIHPIDHVVHVVMDKSIRPAIGLETYYKD